MFSFEASSSVSFLSHIILVGAGLDINLAVNTASCPSLMFTFSILADILGASKFL